jgi:hypothetical protein
VAKQCLLHGFPPKELSVPTPTTTTLSALNIRNGDLVTVTVRDDDADATDSAAADSKTAPTVLQGKGWEWPSTMPKNGAHPICLLLLVVLH